MARVGGAAEGEALLVVEDEAAEPRQLAALPHEDPPLPQRGRRNQPPHRRGGPRSGAAAAAAAEGDSQEWEDPLPAAGLRLPELPRPAPPQRAHQRLLHRPPAGRRRCRRRR